MYFDVVGQPTTLVSHTEYIVCWPADQTQPLPPDQLATGVQLRMLGWPASISPERLIVSDCPQDEFSESPSYYVFTLLISCTSAVDVCDIEMELIITTNKQVQVTTRSPRKHTLSASAMEEQSASGDAFRIVTASPAGDLQFETESWESHVTPACEKGFGLQVIALSSSMGQREGADLFSAIFAPQRNVCDCLAAATRNSKLAGIYGWIVPAVSEHTPTALLLWRTEGEEPNDGTRSSLELVQMALCDTFVYGTNTPAKAELLKSLAVLLTSVRQLETGGETHHKKGFHIVTANNHLQLQVNGIETDADNALRSDLETTSSSFKSPHRKTVELMYKMFNVIRMNILPWQILSERHTNFSHAFRKEAAITRARLLDTPVKLLGGEPASSGSVAGMLVTTLRCINSKSTLSADKLLAAGEKLRSQETDTKVKLAVKRLVGSILALCHTGAAVLENDEFENAITRLAQQEEEAVSSATLMPVSYAKSQLLPSANAMAALQKAILLNDQNSEKLCEHLYQDAKCKLEKVCNQESDLFSQFTRLEGVGFDMKQSYRKYAKGNAKQKYFEMINNRISTLLENLMRQVTDKQRNEVKVLQMQFMADVELDTGRADLEARAQNLAMRQGANLKEHARQQKHLRQLSERSHAEYEQKQTQFRIIMAEEQARTAVDEASMEATLKLNYDNLVIQVNHSIVLMDAEITSHQSLETSLKQDAADAESMYTRAKQADAAQKAAVAAAERAARAAAERSRVRWYNPMSWF